MSLEIDHAEVVRVLIGGLWYAVVEQSFYLDSYEIGDNGRDGRGDPAFRAELAGGQEPLVPATGFSFRGWSVSEWEGMGNVPPIEHLFVGPISSIQALRLKTA